jgi:hypothetical protein
MKQERAARTPRAGVSKGRLVLGIAAILLTLQLTAAPSADARHGLRTGLSDNLTYTSPTPSVRDRWLDRTVQANASIVHLQLTWSRVAGNTPPLDPTNPADPSYDFSRIDRGVQSAASHGLEVLITVTYAPAWAEGKHRADSAASGTWKPNPDDVRDFGQALASRYSGDFLGLPQVRYFELWNEPNLSLSPQWSHKKPRSPVIYRRILNAFYAGVKKVQPGAKVVAGAMAPYGDPPGGARMRPLTFVRKLFCLTRQLKPAKCRSEPHLDVLSDHPINTSGGPHLSARNRNDLVIADFHRLRAVLRAAERAHHVRPRGRHPLWVTEFWWTTEPNEFGFVVPSLRKQAYWIEEAFYLLWRQGASVAMNLYIRDNPSGEVQTGLYLADGNPKPSSQSFRFPFVSHRRSHKRVAVWGKAPRSGALAIQRRRPHGGWGTLKRLGVRRGEVFSPNLTLRGAATLRGTVGGVASLAWRQGR